MLRAMPGAKRIGATLLRMNESFTVTHHELDFSPEKQAEVPSQNKTCPLLP
jgi:hypothetical protein